MGTHTSSGLQDSPQEGVEDVCLLQVGGGQLINCIISLAVGLPLSCSYGGLLVDFKQGSSIILIDKIWVHLDYSSPKLTLYQWAHPGWDTAFPEVESQKVWSESLRGRMEKGKWGGNPSRSAAHIWTLASVHLCWRRHCWMVFLEAQFLLPSQSFCSGISAGFH